MHILDRVEQLDSSIRQLKENLEMTYKDIFGYVPEISKQFEFLVPPTAPSQGNHDTIIHKLTEQRRIVGELSERVLVMRSELGLNQPVPTDLMPAWATSPARSAC